MNSRQPSNTDSDRKNCRLAPGTSGNPSGSTQGSPNRITVQMREAFSMALDELGGVEYLVKFGQQNPKAFITLLSKMLPRELNVSAVGEPTDGEAALISVLTLIDKRRPSGARVALSGDYLAQERGECSIDDGLVPENPKTTLALPDAPKGEPVREGLDPPAEGEPAGAERGF